MAEKECFSEKVTYGLDLDNEMETDWRLGETGF